MNGRYRRQDKEKQHRDENGIISGNVITYRTCLQRNIKVKEKLLHEMLVMKLIEITSLLFLKYSFASIEVILISIIICLTNALNYGLDVTVH